MAVCSCESQKEKKTIEICQETKIQLDSEFTKELAGESILSTWLLKASFALIGLDYETSTWLGFLHKEAEDPIGYKYEKTIYETDLKNRWNAIWKQ